MRTLNTQVAIIGAGISGIATAYYLTRLHKITNVLLIDSERPMSFTSAQSGENYRNWWPHPSMVKLMDRSIDLMEELIQKSKNKISIERKGYALSTRHTDINNHITQLYKGLGEKASELVRFHGSPTAKFYEPTLHFSSSKSPAGVDILQNSDHIKNMFPSYTKDIKSVIHIRRGGNIDSHQLGTFMLEHYKNKGGETLTGTVKEISTTDRHKLTIVTQNDTVKLNAEKIVNAAGPYANKIAQMLGVDLPIYNTLQQKISFSDGRNAIPRDMPFSIDLDNQQIDWSREHKEILLNDSKFSYLAKEMPGGIHCRPDGHGNRVKLGWAYNNKKTVASREPLLDNHFPEIVLRGAVNLHPELKPYYENLPTNINHYGGWYTMTEENWPLIGPMGPENLFMNCALSGFGTMAACGGGELCAAWVANAELPTYAQDFSIERYKDLDLMRLLLSADRGVL